MSHQEALTSSPNEQAMLAAFREQTGEVLHHVDRFVKNNGRVPVGIEVEYGLIDENNQQASEASRNSIKDMYAEYLDIELGAAQIEMRTDPIDIKADPTQLLDQLIERDEQIKAAAHKLGLKLVSHGTNPFVPTRGVVRSHDDKYRIVPNHHNDNQREGLQTTIGNPDQVDVGDAALIGITNSVQANIEALNTEDAIDKLNRSFQIGPMAVSLFGNARFLDTKDTGIQDIRMIGWEISHDTRAEEDVTAGEVTRVGMLAEYYTSLEDYFNKIEKYPFILNNPDYAMAIGIGLNWRNARIKVIKDSLVVEFRPVSTQASPEANYAAMMFYVGRLLWSQENAEPLLTVQQLNENNNQSMYYGSQAHLWTHVDGSVRLLPVVEAHKYELLRAQEGLRIAQIEDSSIDDAFELMESLRTGDNPSRQVAKLRNGYMARGEQALGSLVMALQDTKGLR